LILKQQGLHQHTVLRKTIRYRAVPTWSGRIFFARKPTWLQEFRCKSSLCCVPIYNPHWPYQLLVAYPQEAL